MASIPSAFIGPSLYKLGYVTNDLDQAIRYFEEQLGFEEFVRFEPKFDAELADGTSGHAHLRCAFSKGRSNVVELMEPYEGRVDLWREPLQGLSDFAVRFHHVEVRETLERFSPEINAPLVRTSPCASTTSAM